METHTNPLAVTNVISSGKARIHRNCRKPQRKKCGLLRDMRVVDGSGKAGSGLSVGLSLRAAGVAAPPNAAARAVIVVCR